MDQPQPATTSTSNPVSCVQCQAVTTNDGRTVWVCESCQTVNTPSLDSLLAGSTPPPSTPPTDSSTPSVEPTTVPDVASAQAELNQAASQAAATPIPEIPTDKPAV